MPRTDPAFWITLLAACSLLAAAPALAVPISYEVQSGLGYSRLDASDKTEYLGKVHGELTLDYDAGADTFTFLSSTVWLDSTLYTLSITDGLLHGDGEGTLDFDLTGSGQFAQSGTLVFHGGVPVCCGPDGPNYATANYIRLYGASIGVPDAPPITLNFAAGVPMPEPSAALVFLTGVLFVRRAIVRGV